VFSGPETFFPLEVWGGGFAFTLQIYDDFSAYSDIAIGAALLFGFHIPENFNRPYKATNLPEFWRRWHISLSTFSTWLRDYLYIPLGGNRGGKLLTVRNVMITMLLSGIWHGELAHGAHGPLGGMHGVGLAMTRLFWWRLGMPKPGQTPWWRVANGWQVGARSPTSVVASAVLAGDRLRVVAPAPNCSFRPPTSRRFGIARGAYEGSLRRSSPASPAALAGAESR
jgi:hypothetical protein